jgi:hypothetical protein
MKVLSIVLPLMVLALFGCTCFADTANDQKSYRGDPASLVYVSSVKIDPEIFYPYEQGTITVTLVNVGNQSVGLMDPEILSDNIHIVGADSWNTVTNIGPDTEATFSFIVTADPPEGTYLPLFSIETKSGPSIHYPLTVKIDATDLRAVVSGKPDSFAPSTKETVNLTLINPRSGKLSDILISASGKALEISPSEKYISSLEGQSSIEVPFSVTAHQDSNLTFNVSYRNGDSRHSTSVSMPVEIGEDKTAAVPVVNNVALTRKGSYYDITGDITNTGITDAKGLVVSVGSPAHGTETYPQYAIGSLAADDSGTFEVTFTCADLSSVPLVMTWKDSDGDDNQATKVLDLSSVSGTGGSSEAGNNAAPLSGSSGMPSGGPPGSGGPGGEMGGTTSLFSGSKGNGISSFYPVIAAGIILVIGIVLWRKRKWLSMKLKRH